MYCEALKKLQHAELASSYREAPHSWRKIEPALLDSAKEKLADPAPSPGKADLPYIYADRVEKLSQAVDPALAPLQVFRIGDIGSGTSPCETFAEMGLDFKKRSPFAHSFMIELNRAYMGYLPTPRHFELGGYETWAGTNSLEPQASVKMPDALPEMAAGLAPKAK